MIKMKLFSLGISEGGDYFWNPPFVASDEDDAARHILTTLTRMAREDRHVPCPADFSVSDKERYLFTLVGEFDCENGKIDNAEYHNEWNLSAFATDFYGWKKGDESDEVQKSE